MALSPDRRPQRGPALLLRPVKALRRSTAIRGSTPPAARQEPVGPHSLTAVKRVRRCERWAPAVRRNRWPGNEVVSGASVPPLQQGAAVRIGAVLEAGEIASLASGVWRRWMEGAVCARADDGVDPRGRRTGRRLTKAPPRTPALPADDVPPRLRRQLVDRRARQEVSSAGVTPGRQGERDRSAAGAHDQPRSLDRSPTLGREGCASHRYASARTLPAGVAPIEGVAKIVAGWCARACEARSSNVVPRPSAFRMWLAYWL